MKVSFPHNFTLFARLLLVCLGASVVVIAVTIAALHSYRNKVDTNRLAAELANSAQSIGPIVIEQFAKGDSQVAAKTMSAFGAARFVRCAALSIDGVVVVSWPPIGCAEIPGDYDAFRLPITSSFDDAAEVMFLVDASSFRRMLLLETFIVGAVILFVALAIFLVLTVSFRAVVLRPLDLLKTAMIESTPHVPVRGKLVNDDEIGALVKVYNKLVASSRIYVRRLDKSQASLESSEKRFRELAEVSGDWFFEMDADFRMTFISDKYFELTGEVPEDVIGKVWQDIARGTDKNPYWEQLLVDMAGHQEFRRFEYQVRTRTGDPVDISMSAVPLHDDNGEFIGYRGIGADISNLKENEHQLEEANRNFGDSVSYASSIQRGLLPDVDRLTNHLGTTRVMWQPKDLVGGDFYWAHSIGNVDYLVFFDCTGHGVPGAFMTLIVTSVLDQIAASTPSALAPARILQLIHEGVCRSLNITSENGGTDGLDCAVIRLDRSEDSLEFAGTSIDLFAVALDGTVTRHRGSRGTLGYELEKRPGGAEPVSVRIGSNAFVMTSDGLLTQIGEETKRVLGTRRFVEALGTAGDNSPAKLMRASARLLKNWQGREERRDDVSVICFKPNDW